MNKIATLLSFLRRSEMENLIFKNCNHKTFYIVQFHINLRFVWLQLDSNPQSLTAPKLAKWLSCVVSTYLHSAFDCMFLSCWVRVSNKDFQAFRFSDFHVGVSDIQATIECWFTLKRVRDVTTTYSQCYAILWHEGRLYPSEPTPYMWRPDIFEKLICPMPISDHLTVLRLLRHMVLKIKIVICALVCKLWFSYNWNLMK